MGSFLRPVTWAMSTGWVWAYRAQRGIDGWMVPLAGVGKKGRRAKVDRPT